MNKQIILSGIQPTGNFHIGSYLGAVKNWVDLQNSGKYEMFIFIPDLHSLTGDLDATQRREYMITAAAELIACGIDTEKTTLFYQSHVPEHTELAWIFNCVTPMSELERMTQFKDKAQQQTKNINTGLFTYPILQAADILLYHATAVPVGQDQVQHVELTRDIARWFNKRYGSYFSEPKPLLTEIPKVMSLLEPDKKMSKSKGLGHVIELADEPAVIQKKVKKAVTATAGGGKSLGAENLLTLLKYFGDNALYVQFREEEQSGTIQYGDLKHALAEAIGSYFAAFREERKRILMDRDMLAEQLFVGAEKARAVARNTMEEVRKRIGVR